MYDAVLAALRRGAADDALALARELVDTRADDPVTHRLLAHAHRLAGDEAAAMASLDAALALAPEDANLHLERAGLLLRARQLDEAQSALARSTGLDPNQFPAYVMQAQLALGRGDLDEAERLVRTAARIAPDHPQLAAVEGMLALRRGRPDHALSLLSDAITRAPDEPMLRHAIGFAYLAKDHHAFAEQAFRSVLEANPDNAPLRALVADLVRQQGRPGEAADELAPLLADPASSPALHRLAGELELGAGRPAQALPRLKHALAQIPGDRRTLSALLAAWNATEDRDDARGTLDAALATHPQLEALWLARLGVEPFAGDEARAVIDRWLVAMPDHVPALLARMVALDASGQPDGAEAVARRIVDIEPGQTQAELRLLDALMQREPEAAVERVQALVAGVSDPGTRRSLRQILGHAQDKAGRPQDAAATWAGVHAEVVGERLPLPPLAGFSGPWPDLAPLPDNAPGVLLMWGAPGSMVERLVRTFEAGGAPAMLDRFSAQPPEDPFQRYDTAQQLATRQLDGAFVVAQWRAALPARGLADRNVFDWLLTWDNALLLALRPDMPEAIVMIALRDPRDMLLDWLAFGSPMPLRLDSPLEAARWLADQLAQVADLVEQDLFPHRIVRLDGIEDDPQALARVLAESLAIDVPVPPAQVLGPARLPAGHWQRFAGPLEEAFGVLGPVAARLGYTA